MGKQQNMIEEIIHIINCFKRDKIFR